MEKSLPTSAPPNFRGKPRRRYKISPLCPVFTQLTAEERKRKGTENESLWTEKRYVYLITGWPVYDRRSVTSGISRKGYDGASHNFRKGW